MEEQIRVIPLAGFEIEQEDQVTTGFCETSGPLWQGVERNIPEAFAARQRLWVYLTVITLVDEGWKQNLLLEGRSWRDLSNWRKRKQSI